MGEQDDLHPADEILGADWKPPLRDLVVKAWAALEPSERERLEALARERDERTGMPLWEQSVEPDPDDPNWIELWLLPADRGDATKTGVRIGHWHREQQEGPMRDAGAIVEEHRDD
jgi:hypothetical protein